MAPKSYPPVSDDMISDDDAHTRSLTQPGTLEAKSRKALCIGIDKYPKSPLGGCVADARDWATWLRSQEFEVTLLIDRKATREAMLNGLRDLIGNAQAGEVVAIQYAGHGTQVPDVSGDETGGELFDEALVPIDHRQNGYVIDDDIGDIVHSAAAGVSITFFMDCCHSGSNTRAFFGRDSLANSDQVKVRGLIADQEMIDAHLRSRESQPRNFSEGYVGKSEVLFSACRSTELALESGGHGHFTINALRVLKNASEGLSNAQFIARVLDAFGTSPQQNPQLWADESLHDSTLLDVGSPSGSSGSNRSRHHLLAQIKRLLEQLIRETP